MISITAKVEQPETAKVALTITMPLAEWKLLREQLTADYPAWKLSQAISGLVRHVEEHFESELTND